MGLQSKGIRRAVFVYANIDGEPCRYLRRIKLLKKARIARDQFEALMKET